MDIFQQWLLIKVLEGLGNGEDPLKNEISFEAVSALIKPIFEQEGASLDDEEIRRNLDGLAVLGYLKAVDGKYFLTFRAMVYAQASTTVTQMVRDELMQLAKRYGWQALAVLIGLIVLISILVSIVMVNALT